MKRIILVVSFILLFSLPCMAAESITCTTAGGTNERLLIKCVCVSAADGTFTASTKVTLPGSTQYWGYGYYLAHAYAINRSSGQPDTAGTVTITDEQGQQLVGSTVGDTLTLSTSASGGAYLSADRASSQRPVTSPIALTIGDTQSGAATSTFDLYLLLKK